MTSHGRVIGLGLGFLALLTIGCSTNSGKWYKPGVSQATFSRDKADCEDTLIAPGTEMVKEVYSLEGCLERKGYTQVLDAPR